METTAKPSEDVPVKVRKLVDAVRIEYYGNMNPFQRAALERRNKKLSINAETAERESSKSSIQEGA